MKVILTATVDGLGGPGTVKDVADGYARNFLFPKGLAMPATKDAIKRVEEQQAAEARKTAKAETESKSLADKINAATIVFTAKVGPEGRLYGSITSADIAEKIKEQLGEEIDKRKITLEDPIRHVGTFTVPVHLVGRLTPQITVDVQGEAKLAEDEPEKAGE
jgi:large subunit ribosomal protein L9